MIRIIDNFLENPEAVRDSFLAAGFGTWSPPTAKVGSGKYEGMSFMGDHHPMIAALTVAQGRAVIPNRMFARLTNEGTEKAYIHSDRSAGEQTCIVYLSEHEAVSGTAFYRHRNSGRVEMPLEWMDDPLRAQEMVEGHPDVWEQLDFVRGLYNRALIFDAPLFHSRFPIHGIGETETEGRLIWACHHYLL